MNRIIIQLGTIYEEYTVPYAIARAVDVLMSNMNRGVKAEVDKEQYDYIVEQLKEQNEQSSITEALKPRGCADMPKDIVCNCTKEQK